MHRSRLFVAALGVVSIAFALTGCAAGQTSGSAAPPGTSADASTTAPPAISATSAPFPEPRRTSVLVPVVPPTPTPTAPAPPTVKRVSQTVQGGTGPAGSAKATGTRSVALTFDDGPDPIYTPKLLDLLKANRVKATFCLVGTQAAKYPALVRRIVAEGHTVCNHSWRHRLDLAKQTNEVILQDLKATNDVIHKAAPDARIAYFRAPGGNFSTRLVRLARTLGMKSIYWSVDTRDWDFRHFGRGDSMCRHVIVTVQTYTRPGSIILSHDFRKPDTVAAYKTLLPWLKARYTLIALPT